MCQYITLSNGTYAIVDDDDYERVAAHSWYDNGRGYAITTLYNPKRTISLHRFVMDAKPGEEIDHRNRNKMDCQKSNLRITNRTGNVRNVPKRRHAIRSQFKGVRKHVQCERWEANINVDRKRIYLGLYRSEIEAAMAYDAAAIKHFGDFAYLNFPNESA